MGEGRQRCGEHLPAVMVHSLWLWPLGSLKMQDGERKRGRWRAKRGGCRRGLAQLKIPTAAAAAAAASFSSATFIITSSRSQRPLINPLLPPQPGGLEGSK